MFPIDEWAERHILEAHKRGELEHLSGSGKPLQLDDNSAVPAELRSAYHLMKNSGFLPPELSARKDALTLADLLLATDPASKEYVELSRQLRALELRLQLSGVNTNFLKMPYRHQLINRFEKSLHPDKDD
ncbi:DnaJ family domain-containing protein [Dickeya chrysanthemi]|uniref:DnaJ family domain-containing protein n=1 Tax=Dickeya chrysanthemi TaxID=556 RepID=UPI0003A102F0|nr:DnaJ family domain-containing protein [Dickeya chrysanthemi]